MGNSESSPSTPNRREKERDATQGRSGSEGQNATLPRRVAPKTYTPTPPQLASSASTSTSTEHAQATHSRSRSTTASTSPIAMGNSESKQRPHSRSGTGTLNTPPVAEQRKPSPLSQAVDVPAALVHGREEKDDLTPPASPPFGIPASVFTRPPRLPLPIERDPEHETLTLSPEDLIPAPTSLENETDEAELPKQGSMLSTATLDEDEDEGAADVQQFTMTTDSLAPKVPTTMTWKGEGKTVYVTGTFASWEKKFRMHRTSTGIFTTTIPLTPGTHHITFLVDGDPKTSRDLPTTVDFANALVNYIEVVSPSPQSPTTGKQPTESMPIPGTATSSTQSGTSSSGIPYLDDQPMPGPPRTSDGVSTSTSESMGPLPDPSLRPHSIPTQASPLHQTQSPKTQAPPQQQQKPPKPRLPRPKYTNTIPDILLHLDLYNSPHDERFRRASKATQHLPQPPSLPMFMSKSILNATTPQKDDASVLTMPNHTVLNHLATSSIRNGVLATSGTTRYKRKFLTTIMYKPTSDDG